MHGFTTSFTVEDRHLMKCLRVSKGYGATRLCKMVPDRQWNVDGVKTLIKKIDMTGSIDRQRGSGRPCMCAYACQHNEVEDLAFSSRNFPSRISHLEHSLKILYKSKHFPQRSGRKQEWVFFLNTVYY